MANPILLSTMEAAERRRLETRSSLVDRIHNVDIVNGTTPFCHLINMNSFRASEAVSSAILGACSLAVEHLNARNGAIVPKLGEQIFKECPMQFTTEYIDSEFSEVVSIERLIPVLQRTDRLPSAFLGNSRSSASAATSVLNGIYGYPQISVFSVASELDNKNSHPLFGRVGFSSTISEPALAFLYENIGVRNLALLAADDIAQSAMASGILNSQEKYPELRSIPLINIPADAGVSSTAHTNGSSVQDAMQAIKQTQMRYIAAFLLPGQIVPVMEAAYDAGLAGNGAHSWIFLSSALHRVFDEPFPLDSIFAKAMHGALHFGPSDKIDGIRGYELFVDAMQELRDSDTDLDYLISEYAPKTRSSALNQAIFEQDEGQMFGRLAAMLYDSVILVGLAACNTKEAYFTGRDHYDSILHTEFDGASGKISLDPNTGTRRVETQLMGVTNLVATEHDGVYEFAGSEIATYLNGTWTVTRDIVWNDGTTNIPSDLPTLEEDRNYITRGTRAFCYTMSGVVIIASVALSTWTALQNKRGVYVVRASQPLFLHMLCAGTFLMGCSILPMGVDDNIVDDTDKLDSWCMVMPWLLCTGWCIAFSSLFSKTLRVNKVFHNPGFRRVVVKQQDVLGPMAVMLCLNAAILLAWTLTDGMSWTREVIEVDDFGRPKESIGFCDSRHSLSYAVPLLAVNIVVLLFANYQAFVARKIATEFAESEYIGRAMAFMLVVIFIAAPIAVIAGDDSSVYFFVCSSFVFVTVMSLLVLMFIPKIHHALVSNDKSKIKGAIDSSVRSLRGKGSSGDFHDANLDEIGCDIVEHPKRTENEMQRLELRIRRLTEQNIRLRRLHSESEPQRSSQAEALAIFSEDDQP